MRPVATALVALLLPSFAAAGTLSHSVPFSYDPLAGVTFPVVQGFDTLGGTRQLTEVTFDFQHNFTIDFYLENTGPTAVSVGDFSMNLSFITIFQLGTIGEDPKSSPPFFGPGAFFVDNYSADLAAFDGAPGNDGPDSVRRTFTDAFTTSQTYNDADPSVLAALTDVGALTTVYGGFGELFFYWINDPGWPFPPGGVPEYPTDAALWLTLSNFRHSGTIGITYQYTDVPTPTTAAPLAGLLLLARRRR